MAEPIETEADVIRQVRQSDSAPSPRRPTEMTQAIKDTICELVAQDLTIREICEREDMPARSTVYAHLLKDETFAEQYARAREVQALIWEEELLSISDDGTNDFIKRQLESGKEVLGVDHENIQRSRLRVDTRKWIMSKRLPKKYGDRVTSIHEGGDKPVQHQISAHEKVAGLLSQIAERQAEAGQPESA